MAKLQCENQSRKMVHLGSYTEERPLSTPGGHLCSEVGAPNIYRIRSRVSSPRNALYETLEKIPLGKEGFVGLRRS